MHARTIALLLLGASVLARGQEGEEKFDDFEQDALSSEQMRGIHGKIDSNKDGKVSMQEVLGYSVEMRKLIAGKDMGAVMEEMDADKDGKLSLDEILKDMEQWGGEEEDKKELEERKATEAEKFRLADANGDGFLSISEVPALFYPETHDGVLQVVAAAAMKTKDKDGDGKLTAKEFWEGDLVEGEDLAISEEEHADFRNLDKNSDGFLDLQELKDWESGHFHTVEAMKKMFELADKNNDMHLSADELDAAKTTIAGSDAQYHLMEWAEHHEL